MLDGTNLYLVGMMGAGKSTIARRLAGQIGYRFVDTDSLVESCVGMGIEQFFAQEGEAKFREVEHQVLMQVASFTRLAIATGGGIVVNPQNWAYLRDGIVVWLDVELETLFSRLQQSEIVRPLLQTPQPWETLRAIYAQRRDYYAQADVRVEVGADQSPEQVCELVMARVAAQVEIDRLKFRAN
ncbi:MAG: shikimate kinase [Pseudanabaenaceae cyanobacterium bins.68]|nr:shikimate kinase [Pseudanabaenaceae cyanobacterium bins.68]